MTAQEIDDFFSDLPPGTIAQLERVENADGTWTTRDTYFVLPDGSRREIPK